MAACAARRPRNSTQREAVYETLQQIAVFPRRAHMAGGVSAGVGAFLRLGVAVRGCAGVPDAVLRPVPVSGFPGAAVRHRRCAGAVRRAGAAALGAARAAGAFVQHLAAEHAAGRPARRAGAFVRAVRLRGGVPGDGGRHGRACAAGQKMTKACPFFRRGAGQARQSEV